MSFIENAKGLAKNPLGIIALFVSLIYGFACLVLGVGVSGFKTSEEKLPLIWFIVLFPVIILGAFVFLVTNHHGKLYSPGDYGNPESFLQTLEGARKFEAVQIDVTKNEQGIEVKSLATSIVAKAEGANLNQGTFSEATKENLKMSNDFNIHFLKKLDKKYYRIAFNSLGFGAQAPEYFLVDCTFDKKYLNRSNAVNKLQVIIRVTRDANGVLNMIAIGKGIIETDAQIFAEKLVAFVDKFVENQLVDSETMQNI
jgi:hypothetical protein